MNSAGWLFLLGAICLPVLIRGGNTPNAVLLLQLLAALAVLLLGCSARQRMPRYAGIGLGVWLLWLGWLFFACIPLPPEFLALIAPESHALHQAVAPHGTPYFSISVAPAGSFNEFQLSLYYFGVYLAVLLAATDRRRVRQLLLAIAITAAVQAIYAAANVLSGFELTFPGWTSQRSGIATGAFINRNHFAAWLVLAAACTSAALLGGPTSSRPRWGNTLRRWLDFVISPYILIRIVLITLVVAVVLSQSRMGNISLAIAFTALAVIWLLGTRSLGSFSRAGLFFLSVAVVDIALISEQYGLQRVVERIEETNLAEESRPQAAQLGQQLLRRFGWFGAGPGSYDYLQESVRPSPDFPRYNHAHNDYLEIGIESGYIGLGLCGLLIGVHLLLALLAARRRHRLYRAVGASVAAGMIAALAHATVEFNFQIPGYAVLFVTMMALSVCSHRNQLPQHTRETGNDFDQTSPRP